MQGVGGQWWGGIGGPPIKKMGVNIYIYIYIYLLCARGSGVGSGGPEGPSRWPKATSPPQDLEVGPLRAPYLLVSQYNVIDSLFIMY